jgi:chromosome segregation ATPase
MGEMVMMDKADVERATKDLDQALENQARMVKEIKALSDERDRALSVVNNAKLEIERLRKAVPPEQLKQESKTLRDDIAEAHRKISVLEKELAQEREASLLKQKEVIAANRRAEAVQSTFYTFQNARDQAQADRNKALVDLQTAVEAHAKLQGEFDVYKKFVMDRDKEQVAKEKLARKPAAVEVKERA